MQIILLEDHPVTRLGLKMTFENLKYPVLAECSTFAELMAYREMHPPNLLLVIDLHLADFDLSADVTRLKGKFSAAKFLAITGSLNPGLPLRCLRLGFDGYISKEINEPVLQSHLARLKRGEKIFSTDEMRVAAEYPDLTQAQLNILQYIADGKSTAEIAAALTIGLSAVNFHIRNLKDKLGSETLAGMVRKAGELGYL